MPDATNSDAAGDAASAASDPLAAMEKRLTDQLKATIAGTFGSIKPRLERVDALSAQINALAQQAQRAKLASMTPEQLRLALSKSQGTAKRPTAAAFFGQRAEKLLRASGLEKSDVAWPEHDFQSGQSSQTYIDDFDALASEILDARAGKGKTVASEPTLKQQVQQALRDAGLAATDAGTGAVPGGNRKFTREEVSKMLPAEYAKVRDQILTAAGITSRGLVTS